MKKNKSETVDNVQDVAKIIISVGLMLVTGTIVPWLKWTNIMISITNRVLKITGILRNNIGTDTLIRNEQENTLTVAWRATSKRINRDTQKKLCDWIECWLKDELSSIDSYTEEDMTKTFECLINDKEKFKELYASNSDLKTVYIVFLEEYDKAILDTTKLKDYYVRETLKILQEDIVKLEEEISQLKKDVSEIKEHSMIEKASRYLTDMKELENTILARKAVEQNQAIFPWFNNSLKYNEVFPDLFVYPKFKKRRGKCDFDDLLSLKNKHLAILGEAGAGKSTLLRFIFAFDKLGVYSIYITASEIKGEEFPESIVNKIINQKIKLDGTLTLIIFIDGIDEAYYNDPTGYKNLVNKLRNIEGCYFWIGCRSDYYNQYFSENTNFVHESLTIQPWTPKQSEYFITQYVFVSQKVTPGAYYNDLPSRIKKLVKKEKDLNKFKQNPFQFALLVFLAENSIKGQVDSLYDLYEKFIQQWLRRERLRETCKDDNEKILEELQFAAGEIYNGKKYKITEIVDNNTAIKDLLNISVNTMGQRYATTFYHRSLAAFFLARNAIVAMLEKDYECKLIQILSYKLKDDVTNFIGDVINSLTKEEKLMIVKNLEELYEVTSKKDELFSATEQIIYFITRLGVDVSKFLSEVINSQPNHPIMRLTLAYGAVLSNSDDLRSFALEYAKSIAANSNDAITNRAWTVIYFGDVDGNPYEYQDNEKCPWKNAREARIKRFTKKNPRPKDYRFRLFDIPLFYTFLLDRGWNDLSQKEFNILKRIEFPNEHFNKEEQEFLCQQKAVLLNEYKKHLYEKMSDLL